MHAFLSALSLLSVHFLGLPQQEGAIPEGGDLRQLGRQLRGEGPWTPAPPPAPAFAPFRVPVPPADTPQSGWRFESRLAALHLGAADLGGSPGRLETRRLGADLALRRGDRESGALVDLGLELSEYDFRGASGILPNTEQPTEDLALVSLTAGWRARWSEQLSYLAAASAQAGGELEADFADAITYAGFVSLTYQVQRNFGWTFGARVSTQLEDDVQVIPVLGLDWRVDARTSIATRGPRIELSRELDGGIRSFLAVEFQSRDYRFDDQGPLPEGVMRDRSFQVLGGLEWSLDPDGGPWSRSRLRVTAGSAVWRELAFLDNDETLARSRLHPGLVLGISLRVDL